MGAVDAVKQFVEKVIDSDEDVSVAIIRGALAPWGKSPAVRFFKSKQGTPILRGNVQVETHYRKGNNDYSRTLTVPFVAFGKAAEQLQDASEGDEVLFVGRLNRRPMRMKDGKRNWITELIVITGGYL